ncbi:MAG: FecR family protein [Elusimicrobiales bacterium]
MQTLFTALSLLMPAAWPQSADQQQNYQKLLNEMLNTASKTQSSATAAADEDKGWQAMVLRARDASLHPMEEPDKDISLSGGMLVKQSDTIQTGPGGSAEIMLDGGECALLVGAGSEADFDDTGYQTATVTLKRGYIVARVTGLALKNRSFLVSTVNASVSARGGELGVIYSEKSGETVAGVFSAGRIAVNAQSGAAAGRKELVLSKMQETHVAKDGAGFLRADKMTALQPYLPKAAALRKHMDASVKTWKRMDSKKRRQLRRKMLSLASVKKAASVATEVPRLKIYDMRTRRERDREGDTASSSAPATPPQSEQQQQKQLKSILDIAGQEQKLK